MEKKGHGLKRELKLRDLVWMQFALVFSLNWVGFAAKQGATHVVLWLIAVFAFYLPLAAVVIRLSRTILVEGGVYQWVKQGVSPFAGYMAGWGITVYGVVVFSSTGPTLANGIAWAAGSHGAWIIASKPFALALQALFCLLAYYVNVWGLHFAKWLNSAASMLWFGASVLMVYLLGRAWVAGLPLALGSLSLHWPVLSLATIAVLAKMSIGALAGFEGSAVFAEECRKPENDVGRSVIIAAPIIALMYILGTGSVLAYTPPAQIDVAAPLPQLINAGLGNSTPGRALTEIVVALLMVPNVIGQIVFVGMIARLPMVAGWDGLLPGWWSELHPHYRTPSKAIGAVVLTMMVLGVFNLWGAGNQEAVDVASSVGIVSTSMMYVLLFGAILFGFRWSPEPPSMRLRMGALAGLGVALMSAIFEVVPLSDVASRGIYAFKVIALTCAANGAGAYLYWRGSQRVRAHAAFSS